MAYGLARYHNRAYNKSDDIWCAVTDFDRDLLFLLHDVARLLRVDADKRARAHGMTRAQWAILIWLERQPDISQKELAEIMDVEPMTVARLIDRLEGSGMVERRPDPRDRRIWRLHLRPAALPVLREMELQRADITRILTDGIDDDALQITTEVLVRMKETLSGGGRAARRAEARADDALAALGEIA